jgi:2,3-dihydroxybenzoate decarboxylase
MDKTRRALLRAAAALPVAMRAADSVGQAANDSIRRIAIEEAFVTQEIADQWDVILAAGSIGEPGFRKMGESILADSPGTRRIHERLIDLGEGRIRDMDETGIDMQVISLTSPGVQVFAGELAAELAGEANDRLADAVRAHPQRFAGLAAVAPQLPNIAAREIERATTELGLKGVIINSHTGGEYLDAEKYWPIFAAAESMSAPIYLHPRTPSPATIEPYLDYGLYFAGWGFAVETSLHAMRLIMSGVFDQFPDLKIILGHMGEGIPFWLDRIDNRYLLQVKIGAVDKMEKLPSEYFKDNFLITTSGMTYAPPLKLSIEVLGADRIFFAADYPYESLRDAVEFMDSAPVSEADRQKIYHANAEVLFGITPDGNRAVLR